MTVAIRIFSNLIWNKFHNGTTRIRAFKSVAGREGKASSPAISLMNDWECARQGQGGHPADRP